MNPASLWPKDLIIAMRQCTWKNFNNSTILFSHLEAVSPIKVAHLLILTSTPLVNMLLGGGDENWTFALKLLAFW